MRLNNFDKNLREKFFNNLRVLNQLLYNIIGNKAKGRISKPVFQENKARQIFRKTNISYSLICTRTCFVSGGKKCSFFGKLGLLCFLETLVFALLPTLQYSFTAYFYKYTTSHNIHAKHI